MKPIITLLTALVLGGSALAEPVSVLNSLSPIHLAAGQTGMQALPGSSTPLGFAPGTTSGGFDLQLAVPTLLDQVELNVSGTADVHFEAVNGNQVIDLWARSQNGMYDLSGNRVITDRLRVVVNAADLGSVTVSGLQVLGDDPSTISHRIFPTKVQATSQSSFFYGPQNLFDGNSSTEWKVFLPFDNDPSLPDLEGLVRGAWPRWWHNGGGLFGVNVDATLPSGQRIAQIQVYFGPQETGTVEIQAMISGQWKSLGTLTTAPSTWGTLVNPYPNDQVSEIQVIQHSSWFAAVQADLGEVFLWGTGAAPGDTYQDPSLQGADNAGNQYAFFSWGTPSLTGDDYPSPGDSPADDTNDPTSPPNPAQTFYEFSITDQGTAAPVVEVNGQTLGSPAPYMTDGSINYYRVPVPNVWLNVGENMFWVRGIQGHWNYARFVTRPQDGSASWSASEGVWGDGWRYLPSQGGDSAQYSAPGNQPGGQFQMWGSGALETGSDQSGWFEPPFVASTDGKIYPDWPAGGALKVVPNPAGMGEIQYWGVSSVTNATGAQVLWPQSGQSLDWGDVNGHSLVGYLTGSPQNVKVNGHAALTRGNLFWIPLSQLGLQRGQVNTLTVTSGPVAQPVTNDILTVVVDNTAIWQTNVGANSISTSQSSYVISGQTFVPGLEVFVGSQLVIPNHGSFQVTVPLVYGINTVPVRLVHIATGAELASVTATIVRTGPSILLTVNGAGQTTYAAQTSYTVSGTVVSPFQNKVKVTINGQQASVSGYQFQGQITLKNGLNTLVVSATDKSTTATQTVSVFLDATPPTLTLTSPVAGSWVSHQVTVSGTVNDPAPAFIWVNGVKYSALSGTFSFPVPILQEGAYTYQFQPQNLAGVMGTAKSVTFNVDNTTPNPFVIGANVSGWTNNNTPTITFSTTDTPSGVARYDLSLDHGSTWSAAISPVKLPALPDGTDTVLVRAVDKAGNTTVESLTFTIDTTPPVAVPNLRGIPGNGIVNVAWSAIAGDLSGVASYQITRTPAWPDGTHSTTATTLSDTGLTNGNVYSYTVWAVDNAGNIGPKTTTSQTITGMTVSPVVAADQPLLAEYQNMKLVVPAADLPPGTAAVLIKETTSPTLQTISPYPIVSPIYTISTLATASDGSLQETDHTELSKEVMIILDYDPTLLPNGFPEANLGVYYFDTTWSKWFKVEKSAVDLEHKKIIFTTNHFTDFSVQPTLISDLSPQQLKDIGHNPNKAESSAGPVTVSPQGGTAMTEVTDFVLPGKNGFSLPIKRMYDSGTALADSPSLSTSASLTFDSIADFEKLAKIGDQLVSQGISGMVASMEAKLVATMNKNGDYGLATGVGWRVNFPYVMTTNTSIAVRLPNGGYYNINQMQSASNFWTSNPVSRVLDFSFHEGEDFRFRVTQVRNNITDIESSVAGQLGGQLSKAAVQAINSTVPAQYMGGNGSPGNGNVSLVASFIPGWSNVISELWTKDGTYYLFGGRGELLEIQDKTGLNTYKFHYNGTLLSDVTDDMGRQVLFQYSDSGFLSSFARPVITKMWTKGFANHNGGTIPGPQGDTTQSVNLNYDWNVASGVGTFFNFLPTLHSTTDPMGRQYSYSYQVQTIITGGGGIKINFLALLLDLIPGAGAFNEVLGISALTLSGNLEINLPFTISTIIAPGIGRTDISMGAHDLSEFQFKPTDYFLGLFPTALEISYEILFRLETDAVTVRSSTGVSRTTRYGFHWSSDSTLSGTQYYVDQSTVDDGRTRVVHNFSSHEVWRYRFISWDDYLVAVAQQIFQSEFYIVPELFTLEDGTTTYDSSSGTQLETVSNSWDTGLHRLLSAKTTRGNSTVSTQNYQYDTWGNHIYVLDDRFSNGSEQKSERWSWFLNGGSSKPSVWSLTDLGIDDAQSNTDVHDLLKGTVIRSYRPSAAGGSYEERDQENVYNAYGLEKSTGLWTGDHWATTSYTYYTDPTQLSAGAIQSKTGPNPNQVVTYAYDYSRTGNFYVVTQTTQNVADPSGNVTSLVQETAYDWQSANKLYDKDARGFVTEYSYDLIDRLTDTIKPGSEAALAPGQWNVTHTAGTWEHIVYDDVALTSTVYRTPFTTGASNTLPSPLEKYTYDSLGQLILIDKYNNHDLTAGVFGALSTTQDSQTKASYDGWGDVVSMTDPDTNTTSYSYDALSHLTLTKHADGTTVTSVYDYTQNLKTTTDENQHVTQEWFNWKDQTLTRVQDPNNLKLTTQTYFDGLDQPVAVTDALGQTTVTHYSPFGKPSEIDHPPVSVALSPAAPAAFAVLTPQTVVPQDLITYDDAGQPVRQQTGVPGSFRETVLVYDTAGRVIKKITAGTRQEWSWYDADGNVVRQADPLAASQILAGSLDPSSGLGLTLKTYSSRNQLLTQTDPSGAVVRYQYDFLDRKIQMKDPRSNPDPTVVDTFTIGYRYNDLNRLVSADLPPVAGQPRGTIQFTYDLRGNAVRQLDAAGRITAWTYDSRNRKTSQTVTGADGSGPLFSAWGYDAVGNVVRETTASSLNAAAPSSSPGLAVQKTYDAVNRLTNTLWPDGRQLNSVFDALGRPTRSTDAGRQATVTTYNALNKPVTVTDPVGQVTTLVYDLWGEINQKTLANASGSGDQIWLDAYDALGQLTYEQNNSGQQWSYTYDPRGLVQTLTDPNGTLTTNTYSVTGLLTARTLANGSVGLGQHWNYDTAGSLMSASDGGVSTQVNQAGGAFAADPYDLVNSYQTTVSGKSLTVRYTYDNGHSITNLNYPDGSSVNYQYNGLEQLTGIPGFASGGTYDFAGHLTNLNAANGTGRAKTWNASTGNLDGYNWNVAGKSARSLTWDNLGNLSGQTHDGFANTYLYDPDNRLTFAHEGGPIEVNTKDNPNAAYLEKARDAGGTRGMGSSSAPMAFDYYASSMGVNLNSVRNIDKVRLDATGPRVSSRTLEVYLSTDGTDGSWTKVTDITWQPDQRGVTLQFAQPHQGQYIKLHSTWDERDGNDQPVDQHTVAGSPAQLIEVWFTANGQTTAWTYDLLGNRLQQGQLREWETQTATTYYPNSSRIQTNGAWQFNYDANGNLVARGTAGTWSASANSYNFDASTGEVWNYSYDLANRLVSVQHSLTGTTGLAPVVSYTYDIRGLKVSQTKAGMTTYYQYDQKGSLIWTDDGTTNFKYVEALGEPWAEVRTLDNPGPTDQPKTYYHAVDHEGTTNVVTDSSGNVVWDGEYEAFGAVVRSNGTLDFTPSYTGKQYDADTGLYYYNARFYEPELGRFLNSDPARSGVNWYEYALENPLKFVDPTGLDPSDAQKAGTAGEAKAVELVKSKGYVVANEGKNGFATGPDIIAYKDGRISLIDNKETLKSGKMIYSVKAFQDAEALQKWVDRAESDISKSSHPDEVKAQMLSALKEGRIDLEISTTRPGGIVGIGEKLKKGVNGLPVRFTQLAMALQGIDVLVQGVKSGMEIHEMNDILAGNVPIPKGALEDVNTVQAAIASKQMTIDYSAINMNGYMGYHWSGLGLVHELAGEFRDAQHPEQRVY